ncbi:MAG TPA: AAA family ATPase [Bacteroidia bacterium]|nr:AAA family ATPase [Bacteroidia bacterium]
MKLTSKELSNTHRVIVFGESKSGKTELVGRLAERYNLLYFDLENGFETLLKLPQEWKDRIELVSIPDTKVYPVAIETILKVLEGKVSICEKHGKCSCIRCKKEPDAEYVVVDINNLSKDVIVVIDSLTQLSNSAMNLLTADHGDEYKPDWGDYRNQGQLMDKVLSQIQQARYNIVCITHVVETEFEDGRKKLVPLAGTPNFSRNSAKYFDHVVYCEVKNKKHEFASSTTYSSSVLSGSRTDVAIEKSAKPSLLEIFCELGKPADSVDFYSKTPVDRKPLELSKELKKEAASEVKNTTASTSTKDLLAKLRDRKEAVSAPPATLIIDEPLAEEMASTVPQEPTKFEQEYNKPLEESAPASESKLTALQKLLQQRKEARGG